MENREGIGALLLRVVAGVIFLAHGMEKFRGGIGNIAGWFDSIGLPGFLAYLVGGLEVVGGIALIIGLGVRLVGGLFALLLIGAIVTVQFAAGFIGGYAYDLALLAISVFLLLNGSKLYAVDQVLAKARNN
ncbi:putative membrane protein YphA (DoxX/SURF4 family) [Planomicrobium soli]|uniref:Putative membrane protein YphA (DoxX/SURF4 family) n=1 Tax=Planomicrobium soli TaxID=1176648 RepID=A0A2P8GQQ5_9BACL|nr:DoxX family protein [Planomicrobium soli]PSL36303.1 putative membrane protein YphA (DoxX/SURF4 family) [Planomicrobium soli]